MVNDVRKKDIYFIILIIFILLSFLFYYKSSTFIPVLVFDKTSDLKQVNSISYEMAIDLNTTSSCENILDSNQKNLCKIKLNSCDSDSCFDYKAKLNSDSSLCLKINDSNLQASCSLSIKYNGIIQSAVTSNNISKCLDLVNQNNVVKCRDNYNYVMSINKKDKSYCDLLSVEVLKNECLN